MQANEAQLIRDGYLILSDAKKRALYNAKLMADQTGVKLMFFPEGPLQRHKLGVHAAVLFGLVLVLSGILYHQMTNKMQEVRHRARTGGRSHQRQTGSIHSGRPYKHRRADRRGHCKRRARERRGKQIVAGLPHKCRRKCPSVALTHLPQNRCRNLNAGLFFIYSAVWPRSQPIRSVTRNNAIFVHTSELSRAISAI